MLSPVRVDRPRGGGKPRNILIVSSIFPPHVFGGAEIAAYNRAKLLVERGHNVSIVTTREEDDPPAWGEITPEGFRLYRINVPRNYTLFARTRGRRIHLWRKIVWHFRDYFDKRNKKMIAKILDDTKPDHVDIDNLVGLGFNALTEIGQRDIPVAYILHDLNLACFNTGMCRSGKTCKRHCAPCKVVANLRQIPLKTIPRLGFISPSLSNLEKAKKFVPLVGKSASCVIRNVPEELPAILPKRKPSDHIRLLFVGRLDPVKGIDLLLRVLDTLGDHHAFHLTVLGAGPLEPMLRRHYGTRNWVTFRGFVPRREVITTLVESDLYCIPSLVSESYGLVTAQALQLGIPVIGSNAGGTAELVRDGITGMLVPPGDDEAWRNAFSKVVSNPKLVASWGKNARHYASEFDENRIGQAYEDFIEILARTEPARVELTG